MMNTDQPYAPGTDISEEAIAEARGAVENGVIAKTRERMDAAENESRAWLLAAIGHAIEHVTLIERRAMEMIVGSTSADVGAGYIHSAAQTTLDKLRQIEGRF